MSNELELLAKDYSDLLNQKSCKDIELAKLKYDLMVLKAKIVELSRGKKVIENNNEDVLEVDEKEIPVVKLKGKKKKE
jgi:hypothetical protein